MTCKKPTAVEYGASFSARPWSRDPRGIVAPRRGLESKGVLTVVKSGDKFEIVHQADLNASVAATPAMDQESLYVRTSEAMLAFR